jgi:hypothetical protein
MIVNRVWRKRVKDTGILGEVGGTAAVEDPLCGRGNGVHVSADAYGAT